MLQNAAGFGGRTGGSPAVPLAMNQQRRSGALPAAPALNPQSRIRALIPPANITVVTTAVGLQEAVVGGATDIEIRAHLDLGHLERLPIAIPVLRSGPDEDRPVLGALLHVQDRPRSIRGNCSDPDAASALGLSGVDLLPLKPYQCMLVMHAPWLMLFSRAVWVDNVYLRQHQHSLQPGFSFISTTPGLPSAPLDAYTWTIELSERATALFITNTTFQAQHGAAAGVQAQDQYTRASIYINGCIFSDWAGYQSPLTITAGSVANVVDTVFRNMRLPVELADVSFDGTVRFRNVSLANVKLERGAVVSTTANDYHQLTGYYAPIMYYAEDDIAYDVPLDPVPRAERGVFGAEFEIVDAAMSDCLNPVVFAAPGVARPGCRAAAARARQRLYGDGPPPQNSKRAGNQGGFFLLDTEGDDFLASPEDLYGTREYVPRGELLDVHDAWLDALQTVLPPHGPPAADWPPLIPPPPPPPPPQPQLWPPLSAADALRTPQSTPQPRPRASPPSSSGAALGACVAVAVIALVAFAAAMLFLRVRRKRAVKRELYMAQVELAEGGSMAGVGCGARSGRPAQGTKAVRQQQRHVATVLRQLDAYRQGGEELLGRFELLPRDTCLLGGQTIVQPAFCTRHNSDHVVKLFLSADDFRTEATLLAAFLPDLRLHLSPGLAAAAAAAARAAPAAAVTDASDFLPPVAKLVENVGGRVHDGDGNALPPLLVMGRGQPLQEWAARATPDLFSSIAMLSSIAQRLACLHDAGYVHCALKPSKILLMTATRRWTIAGLTRVARCGADVPMDFSLAYAAPEVVHAFVRGERSVEAAQAMDAWALGVIAYETLTGRLAFDLVAATQAQVVAQLDGEAPLPWEGPRSGAALERLGMLRGAVLHLLRRDPAQRATARQYHTACTNAFSNHIGLGL